MTSLPSEAWQNRSPRFLSDCSFQKESFAVLEQDLLAQLLKENTALERFRAAILAMAKIQEEQKSLSAKLPTDVPPGVSFTEDLEPNPGLFLGYSVVFSESDD